MSYDVFISHSSKDHTTVYEVAPFLEKNGIKCFTDDSNLHAGGNFSKILAPAIRESGLVLLIFSSNSDNSDDVFKELEIAKKRKKTIIPFRIEDVEYEGLEYILAGITWQNGFPPPLQKHLPQLLNAIKHHLLADYIEPPLEPVTNPESLPRPGPQLPVKGKIWERVNIDKHPDRDAIKKTCDAGRHFTGRNWIYRKNRYTGEYEKSLK